MLKMYSITLIFCLSLLITGCGKSWTTGTSDNLQNCKSVCDQQAVMYKDAATNYTTSCYNNCENIETMNQEKEGNKEWNITTNEETVTTDEDMMTNEDCDKYCNSTLWIKASSEEKKSCVLSCKAEIKIWSKDINDCNNIETESEGLITKYSCIATKAIDQKNPWFCAEIENTDDKDSCYVAVAQSTLDKSLCDKVSSEDNKTYCNMIFSQEE